MSHLATNVFWLPKAGSAPADYEDAYCVGRWSPLDPERAVIAIADGATESLLARQWANLLVRRFVREWHAHKELDEWIADTLRAWQYAKRGYLRQRELAKKPIQWYEEPGLEAGAFAALLGIVLTRTKAEDDETDSACFSWTAAALGDCCLFQVRAGMCIRAFPVDESSALTNRPFLLSSNPARNRGIGERFQFARGEALHQDHFYLMTDALAAWFLRELERGEAPWQALDSLPIEDSARDFAGWIEEQRAARLLRNDDVTLIQASIVE